MFSLPSSSIALKQNNDLGFFLQASDAQPWLQISFPNRDTKITKITTWGGGRSSGYVKVYRLQFTDATGVNTWLYYREGGKIRVNILQSSVHDEVFYVSLQLSHATSLRHNFTGNHVSVSSFAGTLRHSYKRRSRFLLGVNGQKVITYC